MEISGQAHDGSLRKSKQLVYMAGGVTGIFLSQKVCRDLGVIPRIGEHQGREDAGAAASLRGAKDQSWGEASLKKLAEKLFNASVATSTARKYDQPPGTWHS